LLILIFVGGSVTSCATSTAPTPVPQVKDIKKEQVWLAKVKNSTALPLLLPATNPLRSLAEMAGKLPAEQRQSVMGLLRDDLRKGLEQNGYSVGLPEDVDVRFPPFPADMNGAVRMARDGSSLMPTARRLLSATLHPLVVNYFRSPTSRRQTKYQ